MKKKVRKNMFRMTIPKMSLLSALATLFFLVAMLASSGTASAHTANGCQPQQVYPPCPPLGGVLGGETPMFGMLLGGVAFFVFQTSNLTQHGRTIETFLANPPGYDHLVFDVDDIAATRTWLESHGIAAGAIEDVSIPGLGAFQYLRCKDPEGNLLGLRQPVTK